MSVKTVEKSSKVCPTCEFWDGERKIKGNSVEFKMFKTGICKNEKNCSHYNRAKGDHTNCQYWKECK